MTRYRRNVSVEDFRQWAKPSTASSSSISRTAWLSDEWPHAQLGCRSVARHLRPALGRKRVREVTQRDIERMLADAPIRLEGGKTRRGPLPQVSANRVRALTMKVFRKCEDWGWRAQGDNPARREKAVEEARDRTLTATNWRRSGAVFSCSTPQKPLLQFAWPL